LSGDHRFLTNRGWKHVADREQGDRQRAHLTVQNHLLGTGHFAAGPDETLDYRTGYLCGVIRGDALIGSYCYDGRRRQSETQHHKAISRTTRACGSCPTVEALYRTECRRLGFNRTEEPEQTGTFRRPARQKSLFGEA
jgi:hypothetical protein